MKKQIGTCVFYRCGQFTYGGYRHHRKQVSAGGLDTEENLVNICMRHHNWVHDHLEKAHELGLIIWDHEPMPTESLLEVRFQKKARPPQHTNLQVEADMEQLLFEPSPNQTN